MNNPDLTRHMMPALKRVAGEVAEAQKQMRAEDFSDIVLMLRPDACRKRSSNDS